MNYEPALLSSSYQLNPSENFSQNQPPFVDQWGRTCRVVCDQRPDTENTFPQRELRRRSQRMIGLTPHQARRIHHNVREVQRNGQQLPTTNDFQPGRINVATWNGRISHIVGFY